MHRKSEIQPIAMGTAGGGVTFKVDHTFWFSGRKHRLRAQGFTNVEEATSWGERRVAEIRLGLAPPKNKKKANAVPAKMDTPPTGDEVIDHLAAYWGDRLKPVTLYTYVNMYRFHLRPIIGSKPFHEIDQQDVVAIMQRGARPARLFSTMLRDCPKLGLRIPTVIVDVRRLESKVRSDYFEVDEILAIKNAMRTKYRPMYLFLVATGLRIGEACALSWCDIDRELKQMRVERGVSFCPGAVYTTPKSGKSRVLPLSTLAMTALSDHAKATRGVTWPSVPRGADPLKHLVFEGIRPHAFRCAMYAARNALGLKKRCSPHVCRHTLGSQLVQSGVAMEKIAELLGHSSLDMARRYACLKTEHLVSSVEILAEKVQAQ